MPQAGLGGIVAYFGAKRTLAPQIVAHFGPHELYYECFAGSLACLLGKQPCRNEVVSEKNPDVSNLIRCLTHEQTARWLWEMASRTLVSEEQFQAATERLAHPPGGYTARTGCNTIRAFDFLLVSWQGLSGIAGTTRKPKFAKRNTASGGSVAARWRAVAPAIPDWHERLRNVEFRHSDAFELLKEVPDREGCVCYIDSPYHRESRTGGEYAFDFTDADHVRLRDALRRFAKTRVVVSHYTGPVIDELYRDWRKVPLKANRVMKHATGGEQVTESAGEVLYINQPE